jgi:predicted nuclease of predicted toxin-antitoxin system
LRQHAYDLDIVIGACVMQRVPSVDVITLQRVCTNLEQMSDAVLKLIKAAQEQG